MLNKKTHAVLLAALVFVAVVFMFSNLGGRLLWQDESEIALLAKSIAVHGYPVAWDGQNLVTQQSGSEFGSDFVWRWSSWVPPYFAFLGTRIFGETPFGFRFSAAIFGFLTIIATYFAAKRLTGNRDTALFSALLILFSIPFLLHARQCRYYSLISFLGAVLFLAYPDISKRKSWIIFTLFAAAVAYVNELSFAVLEASFFIYAVFFDDDRKKWKAFASSIPFSALLALPQFVQRFKVGGNGAAIHQPDMSEFGMRILRGFFEWNNFVFPILIVIVLWIFRAKLAFHTRRLLGLMTCLFIGQLIVVPFLSPSIRYGTFGFVMAAMLAASVIEEMWSWKKTLAIFFTAIFFGTYFFSVTPIIWLKRIFKTENMLYFNELVSKYRGPTEAISEFVREHVAPREIVLTNYDQLPLMLHNNVRISYLLSKERADALKLPKYTYDPMTAAWFIPRLEACTDCPNLNNEELLSNILKLGGKLETYYLDLQDRSYDSSANVAFHSFVSAAKVDKGMVIYHISWPKK